MILHIPHSSSVIPEGSAFPIESQLNLMTDWYTDDLFEHQSANKFVFNYSRFYCDVERLLDDPLEKKGLGIFYTHDYNENLFREKNAEIMERVMKDYHKWHSMVAQSCSQALSFTDDVVVVDCHSYPGISCPIDICIGANNDNTPAELVDEVLTYFHSRGYRADVNIPYSNAMKPFEHENLHSIMIEVNKRTYMNEDLSKNQNYETIKNDISNALDIIRNYEVKGDA